MKNKVKASMMIGVLAVMMIVTPVLAKKPYIKVTSSKSVKVAKGYTSQIKAVSKGKKCKLSYKSSNKKVATVTSKGKIKGKKYGSATITIKGKGLKSKKIKVYIKKPVTGLKVTSSGMVTLSNIGKTSQIKTAITPSKKIVTGKLTYKSSNSKVATVSASGLITGKSVGYADIKVSTSAKSGKVRTCTVFVFVNQDLNEIKVDDIHVTTWQSKQVIPVLTPSDATLQNITYSIADSSVASVDDAGVVTGVATTNQSTTLTVRAEDTNGNIRTATAKVEVAAGTEYQWPTQGVKILDDDSSQPGVDDITKLRLQLDPNALNHKLTVLFRGNTKIYSYSFLNIEEDLEQLRDIKEGTSKTSSSGVKVTKTYGSSTGSTQAFSITLPNGEGVYQLSVNVKDYTLLITGDDTSTKRILLNVVQ